MEVTITLHDERKYKEIIEGFNLLEFTREVNKDSHQLIVFGKVSIIKSSIKVIDTNEENIIV